MRHLKLTKLGGENSEQEQLTFAYKTQQTRAECNIVAPFGVNRCA